MKKTITTFIAGAILFGTIGAFAGQYIATENPFSVQLNGKNVSIEGYNIEGSTYFKLRDISKIVGGFDVDFNNDTIQLSQNGYVYDNSYISKENSYAAKNALKQYVISNLSSLYQEDLDITYSDVRFMLADVSGDDIPELLAVGIRDDALAYIEVYFYENGNITRIMNEHCQGYSGGSVYPLSYNGKVYLCGDSYSSSTGFLKNVIQYINGQWNTVYFSRIQYDIENGGLEGYIVNGNMVSESDYDAFNDELSKSILMTDDFVGAENL